MKGILENLKNFHEDEQGDIVQTGIIIGILAALAIGGLAYLGPKIKKMFEKSGGELDKGIEFDGGIEGDGGGGIE